MYIFPSHQLWRTVRRNRRNRRLRRPVRAIYSLRMHLKRARIAQDARIDRLFAHTMALSRSLSSRLAITERTCRIMEENNARLERHLAQSQAIMKDFVYPWLAGNGLLTPQLIERFGLPDEQDDA